MGIRKSFRLLVLEGTVKAEGGEASIAMSRNRWLPEHYPDGEGLRSLHASRSGFCEPLQGCKREMCAADSKQASKQARSR